MAHFDRGVIDRMRKGDWFERQSIIFKKLSVRRVYDNENDTLIYLVFSKQIVDGSAKMSLATVPLHGAEVTWTQP